MHTSANDKARLRGMEEDLLYLEKGRDISKAMLDKLVREKAPREEIRRKKLRIMKLSELITDKNARIFALRQKMGIAPVGITEK